MQLLSTMLVDAGRDLAERQLGIWFCTQCCRVLYDS